VGKKKLEGSKLHPLPLLVIIITINVVKVGWKQGKPLGNEVGNMDERSCEYATEGKNDVKQDYRWCTQTVLRK
jgi:hypothetical protein